MAFPAVSMSQLSEIISGSKSVPSASYALFAITSSFSQGTIESASYALSASYAVSASHEITKELSSSYAETASWSLNGISSSYSDFAITASYADGGGFWTASGNNIERFSDVTIEGVFYANEKHFYIDHPTKDGMKLIYGTLEGPENAVYIRGSLIDSNTIKLPDYWNKLVDENSITVHLTPFGKPQKLYVKNITISEITIKKGIFSFGKIACYYTIYAERADISKLKTEVYKK